MKSAVTSYMDSQACIEATEVRKTGLGQYLVLVYLRLVDIVNDRTNVLSPADRTEFTLKWVRCTKEWQAMRVNEEAKRAPQGESSLPGELCHGWSFEISANQCHSSQTGVCGKADDQVAGNVEDLMMLCKIPAHRYRLPIQQVWKIKEVPSRLKTNNTNTNKTYTTKQLFLCITKSGTRQCKSCWGIGQLMIMLVHYLFKCQAYVAGHYDMDRALGCYLRDLQGILGETFKASVHRSGFVWFFSPKTSNVDQNWLRTDPDIGGTKPDHLGPVFFSPWNWFRPVSLHQICCININHLYLNYYYSEIEQVIKHSWACKYLSFYWISKDLMKIWHSHDWNLLKTQAKFNATTVSYLMHTVHW